MNKPMTNNLRKKISQYKKSRLDISNLINGVNIKGENLSFSIIKELNRINDDISGCNFSGSIMGEENSEIYFSGSFMQHCNFKDAKLLGKVYMKNVDASYCNFHNCYMPYTEYQHGIFVGCNWCDAVLRFGTRASLGATFDDPEKVFKSRKRTLAYMKPIVKWVSLCSNLTK